MTRICFLTVALLLAAGAAAQTPDYDPRTMRTQGLDDAQGRAQYQVARALYEAGRFAEAGREFEAAYATTQRASLLFNAYLAYRDAGDLENSTRCLGSYLAASPTVDDAAALRARHAAMQANVTEQAATRERERLEREAAQQQAAAAIAEQERLRVEAEAQRVVAQEQRAQAEAAQRRATEAEQGLNSVGFVVGGIGLGLLAGSLVSGVLANAQISELEENCPDDRCVTAYNLEEGRSIADRRILITDILLFGGLAATATGIGLLFLKRGSSDDANVSAACGTTGCVGNVRVRF